MRQADWRVSRRRVERLMRLAGLRARVVRVYRANPALHRFYEQHPNRLPRGGARRPDRVWVGDITYLPVGGRAWRFLAVVLEQCSRRVLSWTLGARRDARLTCRVLAAAVRVRQPRRGLIFHSDRGSEYVAGALRERLRGLRIRQSSAQRGPEDNPHMES
ncbi:MAG: transposase, partial [Gemmatimonadales bacterium]